MKNKNIDDDENIDEERLKVYARLVQENIESLRRTYTESIKESIKRGRDDHAEEYQSHLDIFESVNREGVKALRRKDIWIDFPDSLPAYVVALSKVALIFSLLSLFVFGCKNESNNNNEGKAAEHTLTITKPIGGNITSKPKGIDCGSKGTDCKADFNSSIKVTLTAMAKESYTLGDWGGNCKNFPASEPCTLSMDAPKTVSKVFSSIEDIPAPVSRHTLNISTPTNGTIVSDTGDINCGEGGSVCTDVFEHGKMVTLTATATGGYTVGDWGGDGTCTGPGNTCTLTIDGVKDVTKAFNPPGKKTLTIIGLSAIVAPKNGTVTSEPPDISCGTGGSTCKASFDIGTSVTLTAMADSGYRPGDWELHCTGKSNTCMLTMDADKTVGKKFSDTDVDDDNNGLIEVHDLDMFDHIRHNLAGTSYKTADSVTGNTEGAPTDATDDCKTITDGVYLCGYELTKDLDFAQASSYANGTVNNNWRPLDSRNNIVSAKDAVNAGFSGANNFAGLFNGKGYSISNLYSRAIPGSTSTRVGLFKSTTTDAAIRNLGVVNTNLYGKAIINGGTGNYVGSLVGYNLGTIIGSFAKNNNVNGATAILRGSSLPERTGGLVGYNGNNGIIIASYATGNINGGNEDDGAIGGLVGLNNGSITASYATGNVNGGGGTDRIGGLVGYNIGGNIIACYTAGGNVSGAAGNDRVGGLVGFSFRNSSHIIASYAKVNVNGGDGDDDNVGGLVGDNNEGNIIASYATGDVNGDAGENDDVGALVSSTGVDITGSYGFGNATGKTIETKGTGSDIPMGVNSAADLTAMNAGATWDQGRNQTKNAWDFGNSSQTPALRYADYDGNTRGTDYCATLFPEKIPGTSTDLTCNDSLLPEQGR